MEFSPASKVWVYQANRELSEQEVARLQPLLNQFASSWTAHNQQLKAATQVVYQRFIVLVVDESQAGASGCSIDKSVRFMQDVEQEFGINLFDRFNTAYVKGDKIQSATREELEELLRTGKITGETMVFNNLVNNLQDFETKWQVPLKNSWHARFFGSLIEV